MARYVRNFSPCRENPLPSVTIAALKHVLFCRFYFFHIFSKGVSRKCLKYKNVKFSFINLQLCNIKYHSTDKKLTRCLSYSEKSPKPFLTNFKNEQTYYIFSIWKISLALNLESLLKKLYLVFI